MAQQSVDGCTNFSFLHVGQYDTEDTENVTRKLMTSLNSQQKKLTWQMGKYNPMKQMNMCLKCECMCLYVYKSTHACVYERKRGQYDITMKTGARAMVWVWCITPLLRCP